MVALRMQVFIAPLMFKFHRLSALLLQNIGTFCTIIQISCFMLYPDFMFIIFAACLDSYVTFLYCHLLWFPIIWWSRWWIFLFFYQNKRASPVLVSTIWQKRWQAHDLELICSLSYIRALRKTWLGHKET